MVKDWECYSGEGWMISWGCTSHEGIGWNCIDEYDCQLTAYLVVSGDKLVERPTEEQLEQMLKELGVTVEFVEQY